MSGDISDAFRELRKVGQEKRAANRADSARLLEEAGIGFEAKNGGAHLIVRHPPLTIHFWPGTGLWIVQGEQVKRRGVSRLIVYLSARRAGGAT